MSPTKPAPAVQRQRQVTKPASIIPRRAKPVDKPRKPVPASSGKKSKFSNSKGVPYSVFNDAIETTQPSQVTSYFSKSSTDVYGGDDKENIPLSGTTRSRNSNTRDSPTKGRTGITKLKSSPSSLMNSKLARFPLRELTAHEIFERDEAVLGDQRYRRSGRHSGDYIEFTSHEVHPHPDSVVDDADVDEIHESLADPLYNVGITIPRPSVPTELDYKSDGQTPAYKSNSEETMRLKVEAIIAAASSASSELPEPRKKALTLRKIFQTPVKAHPAVRSFTISAPISPVQPIGDLQLSCNSPEQHFQSSVTISPILARRSPSAIAKASPSPIRPVRMNLGIKNSNLIMNEIRKTSKEVAPNGKKVFISASNGASDNIKKSLARKTGINSLKRAATSNRATGIKNGLESIRRMR